MFSMFFFQTERFWLADLRRLQLNYYEDNGKSINHEYATSFSSICNNLKCIDLDHVQEMKRYLPKKKLIKICQRSSGKLIKTLKSHSEYINSIVFSSVEIS